MIRESYCKSLHSNYYLHGTHAFNLVVELFLYQNLLYDPKLKKQEGCKLYKLGKIIFY